MALIWTPDPGAPLFTQFESAPGPFTWTVKAEVEAPDDGEAAEAAASVTILSYSGSIKPKQDLMMVAGGDDALTVTAETLNGLFPIVFISYIAGNGDLKRADDWEALPRGARDLVEFRPNAERQKTFTLTARAKLSNGTTATAEYDMIILHDWTPGRDRLVAEVNARRR